MLPDYDVLRTLVELTAKTVADAICAHAKPSEVSYLCLWRGHTIDSC